MKTMIKIIAIFIFIISFEVVNLNTKSESETKLDTKQVFSNFALNKYFSDKTRNTELFKKGFPLIPKIFEPKISEKLFRNFAIYYYEGSLSFTNKICDTNRNYINSQVSQLPQIIEFVGTSCKDTLYYAVGTDGKLFNLKSISDLRKFYKLIYNEEDKIELATKFTKLLFYSEFRYFSFCPEKFDFNITTIRGSYYTIQVCDSSAKSEFLRESILNVSFFEDSIMTISVCKPVITWWNYK